MIKISKELLSLALRLPTMATEDTHNEKDGKVYYVLSGSACYINVYTLASFCKEQAVNYGYRITSTICIDEEDGKIMSMAKVEKKTKKRYKHKQGRQGDLLEPEAIIECFQWILDKQQKNNKK